MLNILYEFAEPKREIERELKSHRKEFIKHMFKIYFMPNNDSFDKWCKEVSNYYSDIDKFKHNKKFPSSKFIYDNIFGKREDVFDNIFLGNQEYLKDKYNVNISYNDVDDVYNFIKEYTKWLANKLSKDGIALNKDCKEKIEELL